MFMGGFLLYFQALYPVTSYRLNFLSGSSGVEMNIKR